jgi:hypothetical protein
MHDLVGEITEVEDLHVMLSVPFYKNGRAVKCIGCKRDDM